MLTTEQIAADVDTLRAACDYVGTPCAVAGLSLARHRGWVVADPPALPQLVAPTSRRPNATGVAAVRRIERWDQLTVVRDSYGLPCLGAVDGVVSLAPYCDDDQLHTVIQALAFNGDLDVRDVMSRRRTGLPGSARLTRIGERYQIGLDSPREVEVYRVLRRHRMAPDHLNVWVRTRSGLVVGPVDGYDDVGAAYEVDSALHFTPEHVASDIRKNTRAEAAQVELVRFFGNDITKQTPMLEGWHDTRAAAARRGAGQHLTVVHSGSRGCPCGHRASDGGTQDHV